MDNFNKSFEERLKDKLENHEFDYEPGQWTGMQQKLQEYQENRWHKYWYWGKRISIGLVAGLVLFTSGWYVREATFEKKAGLQRDNNQTMAAQRGNSQHQTYASSAYVHENTQNNNTATFGAQASDGSSLASADQGGLNQPGSIAANNDPDDQHNNNALPDNTYSGTANKSGSGKRRNGNNHRRGAYAARKGASHGSGSQEDGGKPSDVASVQSLQTDAKPEFYASAEEKSGIVSMAHAKVVLVENKKAAMPKGRLFTIATTQKADNSKPLEKTHLPHPVTFGVQTGLNIEPSPSHPGTEMSPSMGFFGEVQLSNKLSLQSGIQLDIQSGKGMNYRSVNVEYGLSRDSSVSNVMIDKVVFLGVPVTMKYKLSNRLEVFGGLKLSSAVSSLASTKYAYYNGETLDSFNVKLIEIGQMPGLYKYDLSIPVGIEYYLNHKISVVANYQLGLTDISDNVFFKNDLRHTSSTAQASLRYRF